MAVLERSVVLGVPIADLFAFHRDARNAAKVSPPGGEVVEVVGEVPLRRGSEIRMAIRQRPLPFVQRWHLRIADVVEPTLVVDEAISTPIFSRWIHEHRLEAVDDRHTRLTDRVTYALPARRLGRLADFLVGRRQLERFFDARHARFRELFPVVAGAPSPG
jgi:ligand-binding SRPBCC domain-containing protein